MANRPQRKVPQPAPPDRKFADVILPPPPKPLTADHAVPNLANLGPLQNLIGLWTADGTGWNMIALPWQNAPAGTPKFRILMNQYNERLKFDFVDDSVKNRGLTRSGPDPDFDQEVAALDYQQDIAQIDAQDFPPTGPANGGLAGAPGLAIHHEPGLWLFERNRTVNDDQMNPDNSVSDVQLRVARLASIPHGNSVCAIGTAEEVERMPDMPPLNGMPSGRFEDLSTPGYDFLTDAYLAAYEHFVSNPYMGVLVGPNAIPGFPGFHPADMNAILRFAINNGPKIVRTTILTVDSTRKSGGIRNLPFTVREAEPVTMKSTFWIQELAEKDEHGQTQFQLQYSQIVMLQFFRPREDGAPGLAVWPHISIATLRKVPGGYQLKPA